MVVLLYIHRSVDLVLPAEMEKSMNEKLVKAVLSMFDLVVSNVEMESSRKEKIAKTVLKTRESVLLAETE